MLGVMLGAFALLGILGVPIVASLCLAAVVGLTLTTDLSLLVVVQRMMVQLDSFILLAIPLFIFAGTTMAAGGITERLFKLSSVLVGHLVGGLAQVNILLSIVFGGLSGSTSADAASDCKILWPIMVRAGYGRAFAGAVTAASATIPAVIPPSIAMLIYCDITGASVGRLFITGIIPGLAMGLVMGVLVHIISLKRGYGRDHPRASFMDVLHAFKDSFWALMMPVIIIGGIRFGVFTPTEAAGVASLYALFVGLVIYRELKISQLPGILRETAVSSAIVAMIIAAAAPFGWTLAQARVPQLLTEQVVSITSNPLLFLFVINVFLLILGCFVEATSLMVVLLPVITPVAFALGIDPIHFGLVSIVNIQIGTLTPPFGQLVFVTSALTKTPAEAIFREIMPFIGVLIVLLMVMTYWPGSYMWLADLMMGQMGQ